MRQSRFREEQIIGVLKEGEGGMKVGEICRKHGICEPPEQSQNESNHWGSLQHC